MRLTSLRSLAEDKKPASLTPEQEKALIRSMRKWGLIIDAITLALAAVVAKPDEKWGEVPCAFVELKDGASADEAEIIAFARERLAGFKSPKKVVFQELPKTSTGKIQKFELRKLAKSL